MIAGVSFIRPIPPGWDRSAACRTMSTEFFYDPATEAAALGVCEECPVAAQCFEAEIQVFISTGADLDDVQGVRGSLTADARRARLAGLRAVAEEQLFLDDRLTVAQRAERLGVSKRTLQRRLAERRAAA